MEQKYHHCSLVNERCHGIAQCPDFIQDSSIWADCCLYNLTVTEPKKV